MKRGIFILLIICGCLYPSISRYSFRILGMGEELIDFTKDNYSNIYYNPAYLYEEEKVSIFSNISGLNRNSKRDFLNTGINEIDRLLTLPSNLIGIIKPQSNRDANYGFIYSTVGYSVGIKSNVENSESVVDEVSEEMELRNNYLDSFDVSALMGGRDINLMYSNSKFGFIGTYNKFNIGLTNKFTQSDSFYDSEQLLQTTKKDTYETEVNSNNDNLGFILGRIKTNKNIENPSEISETFGVIPNFFSVSTNNLDKVINALQLNNSDINNDSNGLDANSLSINLNAFSIFGRHRKISPISEYVNKSEVFFASASLIPFEYSIIDEKINESALINYDVFNAGGGTNVSTTLYRQILIDNTITTKKISGKANVYHLYTGFGREISSKDNNFLIALGYKIKYYYIAGSANREPEITNRTVYQGEGYGIADEFYEEGYKINSENSDEVNFSAKAHILTFNLPVGIEANISKKIKFRMGANSTIPLYANADFDFQNTNKAELTTTTFTHGENQGTIIISEEQISNQNTSSATAELTSFNYNFNSYNMGLGWEIAENINLDIIHFMKTTDLDTWKFSLLIKL